MVFVTHLQFSSLSTTRNRPCEVYMPVKVTWNINTKVVSLDTHRGCCVWHRSSWIINASFYAEFRWFLSELSGFFVIKIRFMYVGVYFFKCSSAVFLLFRCFPRKIDVFPLIFYVLKLALNTPINQLKRVRETSHSVSMT